MRYHKAVEITKTEAEFIIANPGTSPTGIGVISSCEHWYDVRAMTIAELDAFTADLARAEIAAEAAKAALPN
jgi:hypothetical protein